MAFCSLASSEKMDANKKKTSANNNKKKHPKTHNSPICRPRVTLPSDLDILGTNLNNEISFPGQSPKYLQSDGHEGIKAGASPNTRATTLQSFVPSTVSRCGARSSNDTVDLMT